MTIADNQSHTEVATPLPSNRRFGLLFAAVFSGFGLARWLIGGHLDLWPWIAGIAFLTVALTAPSLLTPLNRLWMKLGLLLHHIVSPMVLAVMFFGLIAPMGLVMRILGKRPIPLEFEPGRESYWIARTPPGPEPESLRNQF